MHYSRPLTVSVVPVMLPALAAASAEADEVPWLGNIGSPWNDLGNWSGGIAERGDVSNVALQSPGSWLVQDDLSLTGSLFGPSNLGVVGPATPRLEVPNAVSNMTAIILGTGATLAAAGLIRSTMEWRIATAYDFHGEAS